MLNRTLLVPPCRFGWPIPWMKADQLQAVVDAQQRAPLRKKCSPHLRELEQRQPLVTDVAECSRWNRYTGASELNGVVDGSAEVSWSLLFDLTRMSPPVRVVKRTDLRRDWLFAKQGLGIDPAKAYRFPDDDPFEFQLRDSKLDQSPLVNWTRRIDIEDLQTGKMAEYDLLEFGSLFGPDRVSTTLETTQTIMAGAQAATMLHPSVVDTIADEIEARLGGRGSFDSAHLRVGDSVRRRSDDRD